MTATPHAVQSPHAVDSTKRLRIAVLNRIFDVAGGGAERYSVELVEQLAKRHDIHVFAQTIDHQFPGVAYRKIAAPFKKPRWLNQLWFATATWWATRRNFDIVHSHENTWYGNVQTVHVLPVKYNLFRGRLGLSRFLRWIKVLTSPRLLTYLCLEHLRYAPRWGRQLVVTSESLQRTLSTTYPATKDMISVVTPGITMPITSATPEKQRHARALLSLPSDVPCLLFVGNDYRKKGLLALFKALSVMPADVVLAVVGNPADVAAFQAEAKALQIDKRVFFLGSLKDVGLAYQAADCLVHPTLEDTFAMVVLEAMSHALPVVVSDVQWCGISGLLTHGVNALILEDPTDSGQLVKMIELILRESTDESSLYRQLKQGAFEFAARYQWHDIAQQQEVIYFKALAGKNDQA